MEPESDPQREHSEYAPGNDSSFSFEENYQLSSNPPENDPTNQQQFEPPPPSQPSQNPPQNPQLNPSYPTQPPQYPPQNPQMNTTYQTWPLQYSPQNPQMNPSYTTQPPQYPPRNPQMNPSHPPQPSQYPPQNPSYQTHPPQYPPPNPPSYPTHPTQNPPQNPQMNPNYPTQPPQYQPQSPINPSYPTQPPQNPIMNPSYPQKGYPVLGTTGWTTGIFDCMEDPTNALTTAFFPCLTFGQIAEIIDNGHTACGTSGLLYGAIACLIGLPCLLSCTYRTKLRDKYGLMEVPAPDWVTHCLCEWCSLCQEYRELQNRGLDPSIGWQGNLAKSQNMQQQQVMAPPMNQTMMG